MYQMEEYCKKTQIGEINMYLGYLVTFAQIGAENLKKSRQN